MAKGLPRSLADSNVRKIKFAQIKLENETIAMADAASVVAYGSSKIYDFPEGAFVLSASFARTALTKDAAGINDDWDGDFALGTAAAAGDATLTSTEADILPSTATPQAVSGATTANGFSSSTESGTVFDGTTTAKDVYFNILVDDADHDVTTTPTNIIVNGVVEIQYIDIGDI